MARSGTHSSLLQTLLLYSFPVSPAKAKHLKSSPAVAQMRCAARTCASSPSCGTAWPKCCASWRTTPAAQPSLSSCDQVCGPPPLVLTLWRLQRHLTASAFYCVCHRQLIAISTHTWAFPARLRPRIWQRQFFAGSAGSAPDNVSQISLQGRTAACPGWCMSSATCPRTGAPALSWRLCWAASRVSPPSLLPWQALPPSPCTLKSWPRL